MLRPVESVVSRIAAIATCVEARQPDATVMEVFAQARASCEEAAAQEVSADLKLQLAHLRTVLETWQQVWPRLATQDEFRLALAREARLWSQRLAGR